MGSLFFQRDGGVTIREDGEPDAALDVREPLALLVHMRSGAVFEDGLTPAQMMRSLAPWGDAVSLLSWCDLAAWNAAIARPGLRLVGTGGVPEQDVRIGSVTISPVFDGHIARKGPPTASIRWQTMGRLAEPDRRGRLYCSLAGRHPSEWAHLPLAINPRLRTRESDRRHGMPSVIGPAYSPDGDGPSDIETHPRFFDTVILGFLDDISACGGPVGTGGIPGQSANGPLANCGRAGAGQPQGPGVVLPLRP